MLTTKLWDMGARVRGPDALSTDIPYAAKTWTLLAADMKALEAFHIKSYMSATDTTYSLVRLRQ